MDGKFRKVKIEIVLPTVAFMVCSSTLLAVTSTVSATEPSLYFDVDGGGESDLHRLFGNVGHAEAGLVNHNAVNRRSYIDEDIPARVIGRGSAGCVGSLVSQSDCGSDNRGITRIRYLTSDDACGSRLRMKRDWAQEKDC